eukprot:CAMPEP_0113504076 /NCGR_PEP_ID=MMETSP0014_2-20120614/34523_1 /TAXON_ID=2857 /ORGANISM="Nitzschia sp." /LENGTH=764 /DNA_ID=CAMNT_0000399163 /DNA_START=257 /DNA_END=2554 /DNA_ORIENTATION=+ /assembly_acc=CAM_ASM_000159
MSMLSDEFDDVLAGTSGHGHLGPRTLSSSSGGTFNNNESDDEFDPTLLLSEPLFNESSDDEKALSFDLNELSGLPPDPTAPDGAAPLGGESSGPENNTGQSNIDNFNLRGQGNNTTVGGVYNDLPTSSDNFDQTTQQQMNQRMYQEQAMNGMNMNRNMQGGGGGGRGRGGYADGDQMPMNQMSSMARQGQQSPFDQQQQQFNNTGGYMDNFQGMPNMQGQGQQLQNGQMQSQANSIDNNNNQMHNFQDQQHQEFGNSFDQQPNQQNSIQDQQQAVNMRMMEVQQKIQQVQQQIQHVQLGGATSPTNNGMPEGMSPQSMNDPNVHTGPGGMMQEQGQQGSFQGMPNNVTSMNNSMGGRMNAQGRMTTNSPPGRQPRGGSQGRMQHRSPPGRSISMTSPSQRTSQFSNSFVVQQQQQRQNALQSMSRSLNTQNGGPSSGIDASTRSVPGDMRTMQMAMMNQANNMQGTPVGQAPFPDNNGDDSGGMMPNNAFHGPGGQMRNNSMGSSSLHGGSAGPASAAAGGGGGGFDLAAMAQSIQTQAASSEGQPTNVNEAMEKLCESMRRSAMSRSLVKQLSGKTLQRQHSGRSISRSNSGRMAPVRSNSGRQLSRANSGKGIQRTHSGVQSMLVQSTATGAAVVTPGMDSSVGSVGSKGTDMMGRRLSGMSTSSNSRNRMTPTRGVFRHHSTTAAMGSNRMSSLAAMQQNQIMQQQQQIPQQMQQQMQQQMDPSNFQMDPEMMQQQQQQFQQQQMNNMMDNPNNFMPGGGF